MRQDQTIFWAEGAVMRGPFRGEHLGLSYRDASRRAQAICIAAGKTGQTVNATAHLVVLTGVMETASEKVA